MFQIAIFCKKILGDFYRYRISLSSYKNEIVENIQSCEKAYNEGLEIAKKIDDLDPYKLAIELNYGVFLYQHKNDLQTAKKIYENILKNSSNNKTENKDSLAILHQMDMNITLWENNTDTKNTLTMEEEEDDFEF